MVPENQSGAIKFRKRQTDREQIECGAMLSILRQLNLLTKGIRKFGTHFFGGLTPLNCSILIPLRIELRLCISPRSS